MNSVLSHKISASHGNDCLIYFPDVTTIVSKIESEETSTPIYRVDIIFNNTKRAVVNCSKKEYDALLTSYNHFLLWLEKNPQLAASKFEMALFNESVNSAVKRSLEGVNTVGFEVANSLSSLHEKIAESIYKDRDSFIVAIDEKMNDLNKLLDKLNKTTQSVKETSELVTQFIPSDIVQTIKLSELNTEQITKDFNADN